MFRGEHSQVVPLSDGGQERIHVAAVTDPARSKEVGLFLQDGKWIGTVAFVRYHMLWGPNATSEGILAFDVLVDIPVAEVVHTADPLLPCTGPILVILRLEVVGFLLNRLDDRC